MTKVKFLMFFIFIATFCSESIAQTSKSMENKIKKGKQVYTEILINAPVEKVWQVLTDFEKYPIWNPFVSALKGKVEVGQKIEVFLTPPNNKPMTFKPKVLVFEKNKEFRWLGHLLMPYIFDGEHSFVLADNGNGTTTFKHSERFRGILVPFLKGMLDRDTKKGFELMNEKLKAECEK